MPFDAGPHVHLDIDPDHPHVAWLTLDRPGFRNAWSDEMVAGFCASLDHLEADAQVRVVILTGAGPAFSAGGDLKAMRDHTGMFAGGPVELRSRYIRGIQSIPRRMARFDKPVIAAMNGHAIGAGLDLACMCDLRVCADHAKLGSTFVKVGLIPGDGGATLLARVVGFPKALELILSGRVIDAPTAVSIGLVTVAVPAEEVRSTALQYAAELAANAPLAVRLAKQLCYRSRDLPLDHALELAATYQGIVQNTADHNEGVMATLERRTPRFQGE
jgi:2-(1,2-epoxy-1,2-dihydrophenyl)acetyl-CoA isomerase